MPKVLVTGGAGYVGSVLIPELLHKGYHVKVLDNLMYNSMSLLPYFVDDRFEFIKGDVRDEKIVQQALMDVDCIIHLAAIVGAPACQRDTRLAEEVNFNGTANIHKHRSRAQGMVYASTGSNYGAVENGMCTEQTPLNPLSVYGVTKTNAEKLLLDSGNVVAYRFATAFGLSPRLRLDLLINDFAFQAVKNGSIIIYEKHFKRTFIHVRDMARSFLFALENYAQLRGEVYNVGSEAMNFTKEEIALKIKDKVNYFLYFADVGADPDQRNYEVSYEKIRSKGFETAISVEKGIDELIKAYRTISLIRPFSNVD
ncbi:MAG: SDR family oxidoreductase [Burkholderiaceae bacterium]|nr:SDR family oxidoreductase [Burkholderiaceae bacterium]